MALYLAAGVGIGLVYYNLTQKDPVIEIRPDHETRRIRENGISHTVWRNAGSFLTGSGHPDELRYRFRVPLSLCDVVQKTKEKLAGREFLLNASHFNTEGIVRRTQFKSMNDDFKWPNLNMGSGWYIKAVESGHTPYTSRIIPWTAPW